MATDPVNQEFIDWKQARIRQHGKLPRLFAVVTWGCAATGWVAKVLNSHPDIFSVHSIRTQFRMLTPSIDQTSDVELLSVIRLLAAGNLLAGDVHGINQNSVAALTEAFGDEFRAAGLIREPLKRLRSQFSLYQDGQSAPIPPKDLSHVRTLDGYDEIENEVAENRERMGFVDAANLLNTILDEVELLPRIFRQEDLTTNPTILAELVEYLSGETIRVEPDFTSRAIEAPKLNRHNRSQQRDDFEPWQIRIVNAIVKPQAWQLYKQFGYDIPGPFM